MDLTRRRLDAEQHRRRLRLLADLAEAKAVRVRLQARGTRSERIRELNLRRRPAS